MYLVYIDGQRVQVRDRPLEPQDIAEICTKRNIRFQDTFNSGIYRFYCFTRKLHPTSSAESWPESTGTAGDAIH